MVSLCAVAVALIAAGIPAVANAQAMPASAKQEAVKAATDAESPSKDIVVTARLRAESIQTVPIAITAFTAADLEKRNISNFNDLANATPGVSITAISGGNAQNIYLRGLAPANTANDLNVEANVGVFIDGIYQTSRNTLDMISVLDVGQIEIAKGPQSALFGRSTFAGALSISTKRPARRLEISGSATVGINEDYRARASISVPITDTLSVRVGGGYLTYDGFGKNASDPGNNLGGVEKYAVTGAVEFRPTSELTARLSGFVTHSSTELSAVSLLPFSAFNCGTTNAATGRPTLYCGTLQPSKVSNITPNAPDTIAKTRQVSLELNWRHAGVSVTSTTGFTAAENRAYNDYDGSGAGVLFGICTLGAACSPSGAYSRLARINLLSSGRERVRTFSQEIRLQSDTQSPFNWIVGGSYFNSQIPQSGGGIGADRTGLSANERLVQVSQLGTPPATGIGAYDFTANPFLTGDYLNRQLFGSYTKASTKTFSIFGVLGYQFGRLRLNAEGRYNTDRKVGQVFSVANPSNAPDVIPTIVDRPVASAFPIQGPLFARSFSSFTPRFTADFRATDEIFLYTSAAKGVRSGGFNTANAVSSTGILASEVAYEEESNWTYEAGIKTSLFDRRLTFNASVFHTDWSNAQVSAFTNNPTAVNPNRIVRNAGNIKVNGIEVQSDLRVNRMFAIGGSVIYSDPKFQAGAYDGSTIAQCVIGTGAAATAAPGCPTVITVVAGNGATVAVSSLEGLRPQRSVKFQWNGHASADIPLSGLWMLNGRVDVTYSGPTYNTLINTAQFGERTLTSVRVGVSDGRLGLSLWANNLFDKTYVANAIGQPRAGYPFVFSIPEIYLGERRRMGVTATVKF